MKPINRGTRTAVALAAVVASLAMTAPAAGARQEETARPAAVGVSAAAERGTTLVFDKNPSDPTRSQLRLYRNGRLQNSYRAGSGTGVKDDCVRNKGWMPNGTWRIRQKTRTYHGDLVKGYAIYLQDMRCSRGTTTRTEMFVHSEMNSDGTQGRTERRRWDGPGDYRSNGCVKLEPADIKDLFDRLRRIGWPTHLRVVS